MNADFDSVGHYHQDEVNGFSDDQVQSLVDEVVRRRPRRVLDCMAGDGNLALKILNSFSQKRLPLPELQVLEHSPVQCQIAREKLKQFNTHVQVGDVLNMSQFADNSFDCVVIKSSNHEIPKDKQKQMYSEIHRILSDKGYFINLGFAFSDEGARDDVRNLASCKDKLAGLKNAVNQRYFLMKDEYKDFIYQSGFSNLELLKPIDYTIASSKVSRNYFENDFSKQSVFEEAIANSFNLKKLNFIVDSPKDIAFVAQGEITIAQK